MNTERDKFLTEAMGECWHYSSDNYYQCEKCHKYLPARNMAMWHKEYGNNFSTWEGFGKLWEWAQRQEWWSVFTYLLLSNWCNDFRGAKEKYSPLFPENLINPDRFADAIYDFLYFNRSHISPHPASLTRKL